MNTLLYRSPFIPADLVRAHGWLPQRIIPAGPCPQAFPFPSTGVCPSAKAIAHAILTTPGDAIALADTCDQMRHMAELIEAQTDLPVFHMHVPRTISRSSSDLYQSELDRLTEFLVRHTTRPSSPFSPSSPPSPSPLPTATRLALIGPGLWQSHLPLFDKVRQWGGDISLNATTDGELPFDPTTSAIFLRPNDAFYAWLNSQLAQCNIRGILVVCYSWCDLWRAEIQHIKSTTGLPVLPLEIAEEPALPERTLLRVQSFLEALR